VKGVPGCRAVAPGGGRFHGPASVTRGQAAGGWQMLIWAGAVRVARRPARREAQAGLGLAVTVPVPAGLDAAAGQAGQDGVPVRLGECGGQAGGGRAGPDGSDDGPPGGGE